MNTTRLILNNTYDLFIPISENYIQLKNNQYNTFLLYFGLPNSPIATINDDDASESEIEPNSDKLTLPDT
jgi:predicted small secreted protein